MAFLNRFGRHAAPMLGLRMGWWFESISDWQSGLETIRQRRYGVIDCRGGRFVAIHFRPVPRLVSAWEVWTLGHWMHRLRPGDRCLVYYNQPRRCPNYLVLMYLVSFRDTSIGTLRRGLAALDEVARLKRSDALLCNVASWRISDRVMLRCGWEPHCPSRWSRHFIKRFYGKWPCHPPEALLGFAPSASAGSADSPWSSTPCADSPCGDG